MCCEIRGTDPIRSSSSGNRENESEEIPRWLAIKNQVACLRIENFQELVNVTAIAETEQRSLISQAQMHKKRCFPNSSGRDAGKRMNVFPADKAKGKVSGPGVPTSSPPCRTCGRPHKGECRVAYGDCFQCGQVGHMMRDCPQIASSRVAAPGRKANFPTKAKVYAIIAPEEVDKEDEASNAGIITGNNLTVPLI